MIKKIITLYGVLCKHTNGERGNLTSMSFSYTFYLD